MSLSKNQTLLILAGSLCAGAAAGRLLPSPGSGAAGHLTGGAPGPQPPAAEAPGNAPSQPAEPLANQSETQQFNAFDLQKQADILKRISAKAGNHLPPSSILLLAGMVPTLPADRVEELLQETPSGKVEHEELRRILAERLADLDPSRALELGKKLEDRHVLSAALAVIGEKDTAKALQFIQTLPKELGKGVLGDYFQKADAANMGGSPLEVARTLANLTVLNELGWNGAHGVTETLGNLLSKTAATDPAATLATVKELVTELARLKKDGEDQGFNPERLTSGILQGALNRLRSENPQAASAFFDAIPDASKTSWMFPEEALSRFRTGGVDAAIALAEKQENPEFAKRAASGAWWGLAQQDRTTAIAWIESLPQGVFRQGVLNSVMMDAWMQSMSWGSDRAAIDAGAALLSKNSRMDYFASLMSDRRFGGRGSAPSELIAQLPISDGDKQELYRRIAPVKGK
jgi:hypothetical protein